MKFSIYYFIILFIYFLSWNSVGAQGGGPDSYGYTWLSSSDLGGPVYNWVDISETGTEIVGLTDDNVSDSIDIGFSFHYYWLDYTSLTVGSNGWVRFGLVSQNIAHCFPLIPTGGGSSGDNYLGVFTSDLNFTGTGNYGKAYYWSNNIDSFIVTYDSVPAYTSVSPNYGGFRTFQVILNGADSSITYQYKITDGSFTDSPTCDADIEIGIENVTGNIGLEVLNDVLPQNNWAVRFKYPSVVGIQIGDIIPNWVLNNVNGGEFHLSGSPITLNTEVKNVGNIPITADINLSANVKNFANTQFYSQSAVITNILNPNSLESVTFSPTFIAPAPGQYYYEVNTSCSTDINPSNNKKTVEISIPAINANNELQLTYSTGNAPEGMLGWQSANSGGAIKIIPPGSPCIVKSAEFYILDDGDILTPLVNGFTAEVWDDNAGTPGSLLASVFVPSSSIIENEWNLVTFPTPVSISNGEGFYLSWIQEGASIRLGTELSGPISRRSYEILNGSWATYRNNTSSDFLIRVNLDESIMSGVQNPIKKSMIMNVHPNPASNAFTVAYETHTDKEIHFSLVDIYGQVVYNRSSPKLGAGSFNLTVQTSNIANGIYFLIMDNGVEKETSIIVIEK